MASCFSNDGSGGRWPLVCASIPIEVALDLWTIIQASGSGLFGSAICNNAATGIFSTWIRSAGNTHGGAIPNDCVEWLPADGSHGMESLPSRLVTGTDDLGYL